MKIHFTKREYRVLLDMIYLADWMLHAHESERRQDEYHTLEQKILSLAKEFGCEDLVEHSESCDQYFPTRQQEESKAVQNAVENYNAHTLWDELISRLAERDVLKKFGEDALNRMTGDERANLFWEAEKPYVDEFEINGLDRLRVV